MSAMLQDYHRLSGNGGSVKRGLKLIDNGTFKNKALDFLLFPFLLSTPSSIAPTLPSSSYCKRFYEIASNWDDYSEQEKRDIIAAINMLIKSVAWGAKILIWIA